MKIITMTEQDIHENPYTRLNVFCTSMPVHRHTFFEFVLVTHGACQHSLNDGKEETLPAGTLLLIRPNEFHKIGFTGRDCIYQDLYVTEERMHSICNCLGEDYYEELLTSEAPFKATLSVNELNSLSAKFNHFNNSYAYTEQDNRLSRLHRAIAIEMLGKFIEQTISPHPSAPTWLNSLYTHLTHFDYISLSLDEIIKKTGYSHGYVSQLFKEYFNESLISFHNKNKVIYSCKLLGNMKIIDISSMLGWENPKNYAILFKRVFGCSPAQYIKQQKQGKKS